MCGRYVSLSSTDDLVAEFGIDEVFGEDVDRSWNVIPTDPVRAVTARRSPNGSPAALLRQLRTLRWGLVPSWAGSRNGAARMINARIETVTTKPAFRRAVARRRYLLPALGYYEWRKADGHVVPYFLHDPSGGMVMFAGLYEIWSDPATPADNSANRLWTCTIITQPATERLRHIHGRSPVVVPRGLHNDWLDCSGSDLGRGRHLLEVMPRARLEAHVVSAAVNSGRNNGPALIEPVAGVTDSRQECLDLE